MRHAVVVAPLDFAMPAQGSIFSAPEPVGPLCAALSRGGFRVVIVPTTAALPEQLERALGGVAPIDDLLLFLAARTESAATPTRLRAGADGTTFSLKAIGDAVAARSPSNVLFVVEACHDGSEDDPMLAAEHVDAIAHALDVRARGYGALVGVRPQARAIEGAWPFTRRILYALQDPAAHDAQGATRVSLVVDRLRSGGEDGQVQSFAFVEGATDFVTTVPTEAPPPSVRPAPSTSPSAPPVSQRRNSSMPPSSLPALKPLLDLADGARARGAWEEALAGYKAALMVAPQADAESRASIYACVGDVKRAQNKPREAELNYEKALEAEPGHRPALDALIDMAVAAKEARRAIDWRRKRLVLLESPPEMVDELLVIARAHAEDLDDARAAAESLEEAHAIAPADRRVVSALRDAYEKLHRWPRVVELLAEAAGSSSSPEERAELRFAAADVALGRLRDEERGLALLARVLEDAPQHDKALQGLLAVRSTRGEWSALEATYTTLVDRLAKLDDVERAWDVCRKLGVLRRDKLRDGPGAIEAFTGAVSCKPGDLDSRTMLADLFLAQGDESRAVAEFEHVTQLAPSRASTFARLFALHQRAGRTDRAWLAATCLEELGAADVDAQLVADQYRRDGPIRPSRSLDDAAWDELLRAGGGDEVVAEVLRAVVDAAAKVKVDELKDAKKLVALDPARRQSATATVSAVRSFQWAAQVLGVEAPALYVLDSVPGGIAAVQAGEPSTALGPDVLRGLGTKDLGFLAGRHLTYYRPEHYALIHFPTLPELSVLFLAAMKVALPAVPVPTNLSDAVGRTRKALLRHLGDEEKKRLASAVELLDARDGRVDLAAWMRSVELTANRAGLLLCGDLKTAMTRMRAEVRAIADLTLEQKRGDLLSYCASERLARARALLGAEGRASLIPPPVSQRELGQA